MEIKVSDSRTHLLFFLPNLMMGGAERVTVTMIRLLDPNRFKISLAVLDETGPLKASLPENVMVIPLRIRRSRYSAFASIRLIRRLRPTLVFSTSRTLNAILSFFKWLYPDVRVVIRSATNYTSEGDLGKRSIVNSWLMCAIYPWADCIIFQSEFMLADFSRYFWFKPTAVRVFRNPVDEAVILSKSREPFNQFVPGKIHFVAVGRLNRSKGIDILIQAMSFLIQNRSDVMLHVVGDGPESNALKAQVRQLRLDEYIRFWGEQQNPYVFLAHANVVVLSSRWEGFPNVILEAILLKKWVVVTQCSPALDDYIRDGVMGFIVPIEHPEALAQGMLKGSAMRPDYSDFIRPYSTQSDVNALFTLLCGGSGK